MGLLDDYDMTPEEFLRAHDLVPHYDGQGNLVGGGGRRRDGYADDSDEIGYEDVDESTQSRTVFVQDVSKWTLDDELKEAFSKGNYGTIIDAYNTGKGYAWVIFTSPGEAQSAVSAMNGIMMSGHSIICSVADPDEACVESGRRGGVKEFRKRNLQRMVKESG